MSTRSIIGRQHDDGTITAIYCQHDGYPSGVGRCLLDRYDTPEKIDAVLALGDLSSLDDSPESCDAYGRDRGETGVDAQSYPGNFLHMLAVDSDSEWAYVMVAGVWMFAAVHDGQRIMIQLTREDVKR